MSQNSAGRSAVPLMVFKVRADPTGLPLVSNFWIWTLPAWAQARKKKPLRLGEVS